MGKLTRADRKRVIEELREGRPDAQIIERYGINAKALNYYRRTYGDDTLKPKGRGRPRSDEDLENITLPDTQKEQSPEESPNIVVASAPLEMPTFTCANCGISFKEKTPYCSGCGGKFQWS